MNMGGRNGDSTIITRGPCSLSASMLPKRAAVVCRTTTGDPLQHKKSPSTSTQVRRPSQAVAGCIYCGT
eukprot:m.96178 g.96178  ORF g.96178 m.96178 type:complete len:69 (+) comp12457_c1_seq9:108-314(+)